MSDSIPTAGGASSSTTDVEHVSVEDSGAPMGSAKGNGLYGSEGLGTRL